MLAFYYVALFAHVVGVLALFIASSFELASLARLRGAKTLEDAHEAGRLALIHLKVILPAVLTVLVAGLYMVFAAWDFTTAWIDVSLVIFLSHSVIARAVNAPRAQAIHAALAKAPAGPLSPDLRAKVGDPILNAVNEIIFAQILGIVFMMTIKPGLIVALLVVIVATLIGLVPTLLRRRKAALASIESDASESAHALSVR
ncbi:MAG TPA: DUF2269 family protein [Ktedonobacterales bacterium]|nr:DUF2269 family protein [Ktedonobacterales bacterium]